MRQTIRMLSVVTIVALTGCSEFITSEKPAPTSVVDVVGDPSDPVADSTEESEILGAENSASIQIIADADSDSAKSESSDVDVEAPSGTPGGSDQANAIEKQKSTRLKTTQRDKNIAK